MYAEHLSLLLIATMFSVLCVCMYVCVCYYGDCILYCMYVYVYVTMVTVLHVCICVCYYGDCILYCMYVYVYVTMVTVFCIVCMYMVYVAMVTVYSVLDVCVCIYCHNSGCVFTVS